MILVELFILVLLVVAQSSIEKKDHQGLIVQNVPQYPFQLERPFEITISPKNQNESLINTLKETMVVRILDDLTSEEDVAVFDFGSKEMIDKEFVGEFMRIPVWEVNVEKRVINLTIFFKKSADRKTLEIYHVNATTSQERRSMLEDLRLAKFLYRSKISLLILPEIDISVNSDRYSSKLYLNTNNVATCRSYDGIPRLKPYFIDPHLFSDKSTVFSEGKNEIEMRFNATVKHHNKNLTCQVGTIKKSVKIRVFHHPSKVTFEPEINGTFYNGSSVTCTAADGYPKPRISWHFEEGPKLGFLYFQILQSSRTLYIKPNAPIGSKWRFTCRSVNMIYTLTTIYSRTISFTIEKKVINRTAYTIPKSNWTNDSATSVLKDYVVESLALQNHRISSLNLKISKQSGEISNLTNAIKKFEYQKEPINKLKKFVEKEIKSLKDDVVILKSGSASKKDDKLDGGERIINKPGSRKRAHSVEWKFYNIGYLRRKFEIVDGAEIHNKVIPFNVSLWISFISPSRIEVGISRYPDPRDEENLFRKATGIVTIYNGNNRKIFRQSSERSVRVKLIRQSTFDFPYDDYLKRRVLGSDEIIVEYSVVFED